MPRPLVAAVVIAVVLAALLAGPTAFTVVVLVLAVLALLDLSLLLASSGAKPVLPVAAIPGLLLPLAVAGADPLAGWEALPGFFAVALLAAFALILVFGRRTSVVAGLGATVAAGLVVGLGAASLLLLRGLAEGFRWVLALAVLVLAAEVAGPLARAVRSRADWDPGDDVEELPGELGTAPLEGIGPALLAVAVGASALTVWLAPPVGLLAAALLAVIALVATLGGAYLQHALATEAGVDTDHPGARPGEGLLLGAAGALLLGAPAVYILARSAAL